MNRFIEYALGHDNVWFATMSEVGGSMAAYSGVGGQSSQCIPLGCSK